MASHSFFLCILLTFSLSIHGISAAIKIPKYVVINEVGNKPGTGGDKFEKMIGIPAAKEIMDKIFKFAVTTVFQQNTPEEQKQIVNNTIYVFIVDLRPGIAGAMWDWNKINVSAGHIQRYQGDLKWDFTSLLYHEMTHLLHFDAERKMPWQLNEGIADYMTLRANYYPPGAAKPGSGEKWDQAYEVTARFLEYCDSVTPGGFVVKLNKMSRKNFDIKYFKDITGKPVEQLWKDYKAKYGQKV